MPPTPPLRVAVIVASNREGRFAPTVTDWFMGYTVQRDDIDTDVIDVARHPLPLTMPRSADAETAKAAGDLAARLERADAFVVITPEYNHSFPAGLKNLIDWHYTQWRAKPVGFVSYGGLSGGLRAVEQLRLVFAEMHAVTVRDTVSFHNAGGQFGDDGELVAPEGPGAAAKVLLDQVVWWARGLSTARKQSPYQA